MQELSTSDYLIKKLYNETEPTENQAIDEAFLRNPSLKEKYSKMKSSKKLLEEATIKSEIRVSQKTIDNILKFSKLTAILNYKN